MMNTLQSNQRTGGFTLVEMLIAMAVFAVLITAISGVFFSALRLRQTTADAVDAAMPLDDAAQVMTRDLANLVGSRSGSGTFFGPLQTTNPTNALRDQVGPWFYTSDGELDGMAPWGNVQRVAYVLAAPTNQPGAPGKDLWRAVEHNLLPVTPPSDADEKQLLLHNVRSIAFLYYDGAQWDSDWDTTLQTNLPTAIKAQIQMAGPAGQPLAQAAPLEIVVPIDVLVMTNQTALP